MATVTYNRGDWSGQEIEVEIDKEENILKLYDELFKIEYKDDGAVIKGLGEYKHIELLAYDDSSLSYNNDTHWSVFDKGNTISRDSEDIYEATTQVLCNLL